MNKVDEKYFEDPEKYIPQGWYCYNECGACPFWDKDETKPYQENGYCHYLKSGDWEDEGTSLVWDMVKECGVKDENPEEY